jgi:AraC family transcriptional regulator
MMKEGVLETDDTALRNAPHAVRAGAEKYGATGLLLSSADRGWSGLSAELRSHSSGIVAWKFTQPHTEVSVDIRGNGSVVRRQGGGIFERTVAERGTIWLSPAGMLDDFVELSDPVPAILHIYLPSSLFSSTALEPNSINQ